MKKISFLITFLLFAILAQSGNDTVRIACVGNSITYGSGIKDRDNDSYPAVLGKLLGDKFLVRNFGLSGRTLLNKGDYPYMKEKMYQEVLAFCPDIVVIKLGTNDSKPQNWKFQSEFKQDLTTMVTSFQSLSSKPKIYLCYPAKAYTIQWGINDSIIVNGVIPYINDVAKEKKLEVIDLHELTSGMPENFPDKIHPNPNGAKIMAKIIYKTLLNDIPSIEKQASKWVKSRVWANGVSLNASPSVDALEFQREYKDNKVWWDKVFTWLKDNNPSTVALGKYVIDSANVTVNVTEGPSVRTFEKTKWEAHKNFVDLQYIAKGKEKMGIAPISKAKMISYDEKKDNYSFQLEEADSRYIVAEPGTFLLFFPSDAHRPNIQVEGCDTVKKIVFKIRSCNSK